MSDRFKNFGEDTVIYKEGDWPTEAYRILRGNVEISVSSGGRQVITGTLGPGDVFGEMSLLQQCPREVTARTLGDTDLQAISADDFLAELCASKTTLSKYLHQVYWRLRATSERLRAEMARHDHPNLTTAKSPESENTPAAVDGASALFQVKFISSVEPKVHQPIDQFPFSIGGIGTSNESGEDFADRPDSYQFKAIADDSSAPPSNPHAAIEFIDDACFIRDLDSDLGTIVNGLRIGNGARDDIARLKPGLNTVVLGDDSSPYRVTVVVSPTEQSA